ncbi:MAG TPA: hypothetical protein VFZ08_05470 [Terriglobia bacterium]|nr:hypothetical protein [Terriglobia bacterium]
MRLEHKFQAQIRSKIVPGAMFLSILALFGLVAPGFPQGKLRPLRIHVGEKAPNFALPSASGKMINLSSLRGHSVLIDFYEGYW